MTAPGAACNIAGSGRRRRALTGAACLVAAVAAFVVLDDRIGGRWWRLGLVPVLAFAFLCLFQAQAST
jgi:hypothetical protein